MSPIKIESIEPLKFSWALIIAACLTIVLGVALPAFGNAAAMPQPSGAVESGLSYLIGFCASDQESQPVAFDQIQPVIDFIRQAPQMADYQPGDHDNTKGSFIAFSVKRTLTDIVRYAYNRRIPEGAINASSVNFSRWKKGAAEGDRQVQDLWKRLDDLSVPYVARGVVREAIAPDLHTGTYYEYDLKRTFVIFRQGHSRIMISLSCLIGRSEVGKKGYIIGRDQDWNYLYTQDTGLNKPGLGWVKPRISRFYSACCFIEDQPGSADVKIGVFQWLGAGWIGMNVVDSHHIRRGLKRFADQFKAMIESQRMPAPVALEKVYQSLEQTDEAVLRQKAGDVTRHIQDKAEKDDALRDKPAIRDLDAATYVAAMTREQLVTILMREYLKYCLGKETPLDHTFWVALKKTAPAGEHNPA